jgi:hypothetical protein
MDSLAQKLVGTWIGSGVGIYPPRVSEFRYVEELIIRTSSKPTVLEFRSATKNEKTSKPMHVEVGFIRFLTPETVEFVVSHPFGVNEISAGRFDETLNRLEVSSSIGEGSIQRVKSASAPYTSELKRVYELSTDGTTMVFSMDMATSLHPTMQNHLVCKYIKK